LNFINLSLYLLAPENSKIEASPKFPLPDYARQSNLHIRQAKKNKPQTLSVSAFLTDGLGRDSIESEQARTSLLVALLKALEAYIQQHSSASAFIEAFEPSLNVVQAVATGAEWNKEVKKSLDHVSGRLQRQIKFAIERRTKTPLRMQHHRPIPIAQYVPKFEEGYSMDKHYDPDHERSQFNKLKAQTAKERKGAIRELRKDNMFMAREKLKTIKQKDEQYQKMVTGVMTVLEADQAEKKELEFQKRKEQGKFH
jgi:nucleolar protein 14